MAHTIEITYTNEDDETTVVRLPARKEVCPGCDGHGFVLNEGMRGYAYSAEEFADAFDEDAASEYFRHGGRYDVRCDECQGRNVIDEVDEDNLTAEQRVHFDLWCAEQDALNLSLRIEESERRAGA